MTGSGVVPRVSVIAQPRSSRSGSTMVIEIDVLEALEVPVDDRAVRPRAGERDVEVVAAALGGIPRAAVGADELAEARIAPAERSVVARSEGAASRVSIDVIRRSTVRDRAVIPAASGASGGRAL